VPTSFSRGQTRQDQKLSRLIAHLLALRKREFLVLRDFVSGHTRYFSTPPPTIDTARS